MKMQGFVRQHDKFQLEMKFTCPVDRAKSVNDYHIELFFFLPRNLAVNQQTCDREIFYNALSEYIRLTTPKMDVSHLARPDNPPLKRLSEAQDAAEYTEQMKLYCSIVSKALRDGLQTLLSLPPGSRDDAVAAYLRDGEQALTLFRSLRPALLRGPEERLELFELVDEYLSITANNHIFELWQTLLEEDDENAQKLIALLRNRIRHELDYRKEMNYPTIARSGSGNSELLYRESTLKKAMGSVLYLNTSTRKDGVLIENLLLSIAAALAMIFATGISFLWKGLFLEEFSLSFFVVWVIAYMFKDRIKALLQGYFATHREHYTFDYKQKITDAMGRVVGICHEGMCFSKEEALEPKLRDLRDRPSLSRMENSPLSEEILVFRKRIELFTEACEPLYQAFSVDGVTDIVRFNVQEWLRKMDNPVRELCTLDEQGELVKVKARRIYHVNLIVRYGGKGQRDEYLRYRLILDRNGIRKIEWIR